MQQQIIILVNSLEQCRYFYRETLKLGEPATDSSETAIFKLDTSTSLVLEKCEANYLEHSSSAVSWSVEVDGFDEISAELEKNGYTTGEEFIRFGRRTRKIHDPESNPLYITAAKPAK